MSQFLRLLVIQKVLISHGLDEIIFTTHFLRPIRFLFYILPWNWFAKNKQTRAVRIRLMLEELGPIYVKLGQILSTRRDLIPEDIADEFAKLQDNVAPFPGGITISRCMTGRSSPASVSEPTVSPESCFLS